MSMIHVEQQKSIFFICQLIYSNAEQNKTQTFLPQIKFTSISFLNLEEELFAQKVNQTKTKKTPL